MVVLRIAIMSPSLVPLSSFLNNCLAAGLGTPDLAVASTPRDGAPPYISTPDAPLRAHDQPPAAQRGGEGEGEGGAEGRDGLPPRVPRAKQRKRKRESGIQLDASTVLPAE